MNITILGTGAMACLFGARLAPVAQVSLVGNWAEGLAALREHGVLVEETEAHGQSEDGRPVGVPASQRTRAKAVPLNAASGDEPAPPADLVLVLVKAWQTPWAAGQLPARLAPGGVALTLQNGLGNLETLAAAVPGERVCLGVTTEGATLVGPGRVRPGGAGATHVAGPAWVVELLARAGFDAYPAGEAEVDGLLWGKLAVNCGINALTALLRVPNGHLLRLAGAQALMAEAAEECAAVAAARGIALPFDSATEQARAVAKRTAINHSSMFQDILRGAPTEVDAINGAVARLGEQMGLDVPVNTTLWRLVGALVQARELVEARPLAAHAESKSEL